MKYDDLTKHQILYLSGAGFSGRQIAYELGLSKSGVNDFLNRTGNRVNGANLPKGKGPRILYIDIETAAAQVLAFGRYDVNITENHVLVPGDWLLSVSYAFNDEPVGGIGLSRQSVLSQDDSELVCLVYELMENADVVIAHNGKKFDFKILQARALAHNLGVLPSVKFVDTLKLAKAKIKVPSFSLDSMCAYFGIDRKIQTEGIGLWKRVQSGDTDAMVEMIRYNVQDVVILRDLYKKIASLGDSGYNAALYFNDDISRCKACGSHNIAETGRTVETGQNSYAEVECLDCGAKARKKQSLLTKEKRKNLLA